ncbi:protease prsW family-domain-containing protein [Hypoxylon fuscum]|nr:protease prsW family-domain-containing protein [Hypoxylon fuscum]
MEGESQVSGNASQRQFSRSTKVLIWIVLPAVFVALGTASPLTAFLSLFILAPTFWLIRYDRAHPLNQRLDPETFIWTYILTGTVGTAIVIVVQSILSYALALALFREETRKLLVEIQRGEDDVAKLDPEMLATRRQMASQWQYWVFMLVFAFFAAGFPEELLKYSGLVYARRRGRITHEHNYITLGAAAALGFSTVENIAFVYAATRQNQNPGKLLLTLVERVVIGSPMHVMGGLLIGLSAVRRDFYGESFSLAQILGIPILFHGTWDFSLFGISALDGNVGWVHPRGKSLLMVFGIAIAIQGILALIIRKRFVSWKADEHFHSRIRGIFDTKAIGLEKLE